MNNFSIFMDKLRPGQLRARFPLNACPASLHRKDADFIKSENFDGRLSRTSLLFSVILLLLFGAGFGFSTASAQEGDRQVGLIQVMSPKAYVKIKRIKGVEMKVGDIVPLFQQNEKYFIGLVDRNGEPTLAAFPVKNFQNQANGWVTAQKTLVFAQNTESKTGKLYLRKGENLPVLDESKKYYSVDISRYGRNHTLDVPKKIRGVHYRDASEVPPEALARSRKVRKITLADLEPRTPPPVPKSEVQTNGPALADTIAQKGSAMVAAAKKKISSLAADEEKQPVSNGPLLLASEESMEKGRKVHYRPKTAYQQGDVAISPALIQLQHLLNALEENSLAVIFILFLTLIIGAGYVRYQRKQHPKPRAEPSEVPDPGVEQPVQENPVKVSDDTSKPANFTGSLEIFEIQNLIQFLHNSSSTGVLNLEVEGLTDPGRVIFNMGEVKHATIRGLQGTEAFTEIFGLHKGNFRFQLSQQLNIKETIHNETSELIDQTAKLVQQKNDTKIINFGDAG